MFEDAGVDRKEGHVSGESGARRSLADGYYASLDLTRTADAQKLLRVFAEVIHGLEERIGSSPWGGGTSDVVKSHFDRLVRHLDRDGYVYQGGRLEPKVVGNPMLPEVEAIAVHLDADYLNQQVQRCRAGVDADPWLAVGTAKELVETICKTILRECGEEPVASAPLAALVKACSKQLGLCPEDVDNAHRAADTIRRILGSLGTVTQGLAELRNSHGTGHGQDARSRGLKPRHARLAVGAAVTVATFLFETFQERTSKAPTQDVA
ncbi:MAG: abortive infection family protein [Planctomycetes bacterium]|nr:abortive infection family protein [Planctomycetota bacterium]